MAKHKIVTIAPGTELYDAIVMNVMDNNDYEDDNQVTQEEMDEFVTSILWHALESR